MMTRENESAPTEKLARLLLQEAKNDPQLLGWLDRALKSGSITREISALRSNKDEGLRTPETFMVGNSAVMQTVFDLIRRFAKYDVPVLITGESGTGKELAARAIHDHSSRAGQPFVAINCAALPPGLIASELFGYEKGAFTGAITRKPGQIEQADGGTLLLDEIGDLPVELQGHLLRFLQAGEVLRVGGHTPTKVNVRIIAATNVRLPEAIAQGRFREDLFYRLNVLSLRMPALRERNDDIEVLAIFLLRRIAAELGCDVRSIEPEAMAAMRAYRWPGNVREIIATLRRAVVIANGPCIKVEDLCFPSQEPEVLRQPFTTRPATGSPEEKEALIAALGACRSNITRAAQRLGVSRVTLYRMMRRHDLESAKLASQSGGIQSNARSADHGTGHSIATPL
jgi:DNA-binding NtrC family response regulator